jgi:two-component system, response regulator PdtaR
MTIPLKTIAIAEDEKALCALLQRGLVQLGYEIVGVAKNGEEASEIVKLKQPQLILMDVHMPLVDGMEAAKRIIAVQKTAIVLLTGDGNPNLAHQALEMGICGYVQKPCDLAQLGPIMETAWHQFQVVTELQKQMGTLTESLETRKLLEKAQGILMEQQGLSEESAHKAVQKMSQDQGISIKEVCRSIIQVKMVLGKMAPKRVV